ncbi:MAG: hypothetical protein HY840_07095 [Bacteroidetes bacterium]|nr:hypothetical protein [Bacteroidota bacterium]
MSKEEFQKQIQSAATQLNEKELEAVYSYLLSFLNNPRNQGKELVSMAGTVTVDDLKLMEEAINNGCEKIDANEW